MLIWHRPDLFLVKRKQKQNNKQVVISNEKEILANSTEKKIIELIFENRTFKVNQRGRFHCNKILFHFDRFNHKSVCRKKKKKQQKISLFIGFSKQRDLFNLHNKIKVQNQLKSCFYVISLRL